MSAILDQLKTLYDTREDEIERWLAARRADAAPPLTCSVDLRHSGARLVPVDSNLYPAGFNNLSPAAAERASRFFRRFLDESYPHARTLLIVPENHTRNLAYLDSLALLTQILESAGLEVRIGSLAAEHGAPLTLTSLSGHTVTEWPLTRNGQRLATEDGFASDLVLLNNDCTAGPPPLLMHLAQPILPPVEMGWYQRRKSDHFHHYCALIREFGAAFSLDPWLLCAEFRHCGSIDFKAREGLDALARTVDEVLAISRARMQEHGIAGEAYAFVKADGGTYGMGIMAVRSGEEILTMNKKDRNKMQVVKEGAVVSDVIVQEGVPTIDQVEGSPAEPMVYLVDGVPAGGMYRANAQRDAFVNLNASGMVFTGMCDEAESASTRQPVKDCHFRAFGFIAALAALAAGREMKTIRRQEAA